jgi:hypothetical protein
MQSSTWLLNRVLDMVRYRIMMPVEAVLGGGGPNCARTKALCKQTARQAAWCQLQGAAKGLARQLLVFAAKHVPYPSVEEADLVDYAHGMAQPQR